MCTDEQWTPKHPLQTLQTSAYWLKNPNASNRDKKEYFSFWLTPLDVPKSERNWFLSFPAISAVCQTHMPAKLK